MFGGLNTSIPKHFYPFNIIFPMLGQSFLDVKSFKKLKFIKVFKKMTSHVR